MSANVGDIIDNLLRPVRTLDLRKRVAAAQRAEVCNSDYRESAIRRQTRAGARGVRIHVGEIIIRGVTDVVAVAGIAELILTIESAAKFIDEPGIGRPRPVDSHYHRLGMSKRGPVVLGRGIILWTQSLIVTDEVLAGNGVFVIKVVIDFTDTVMKVRSADRRNGIRDSVSVLKHSGILRVLRAITWAAIDEARHLEAEVFWRG